MPEDIRWKQRFDNYKRALHQLTLAVQLLEQRPLSDLEKQGMIQGFEFTHELAWNALVLQIILQYEVRGGDSIGIRHPRQLPPGISGVARVS